MSIRNKYLRHLVYLGAFLLFCSCASKRFNQVSIIEARSNFSEFIFGEYFTTPLEVYRYSISTFNKITTKLDENGNITKEENIFQDKILSKNTDYFIIPIDSIIRSKKDYKFLNRQNNELVDYKVFVKPKKMVFIFENSTKNQKSKIDRLYLSTPMFTKDFLSVFLIFNNITENEKTLRVFHRKSTNAKWKSIGLIPLGKAETDFEK